jgi:hypothetical protein
MDVLRDCMDVLRDCMDVLRDCMDVLKNPPSIPTYGKILRRGGAPFGLSNEVPVAGGGTPPSLGAEPPPPRLSLDLLLFWLCII